METIRYVPARSFALQVSLRRWVVAKFPRRSLRRTVVRPILLGIRHKLDLAIAIVYVLPLLKTDISRVRTFSETGSGVFFMASSPSLASLPSIGDGQISARYPDTPPPGSSSRNRRITHKEPTSNIPMDLQGRFAQPVVARFKRFEGTLHRERTAHGRPVGRF